ncbi:ADP-ribose diphosphatase [Weissella oryzae SG25]|uniref:ADP-ribose diphosphatase n=1 Tax=Weissella oryzae (strain DSM 25784 / JCM 18191 / LMG 30913 / SG25) TaxID=1329250 RepID=A0A069CT90_WEIOS|nr:NUDIX domain-containing protein [Weissella oryzae]GAK30622.1 ADP-ribose diphosphatase [Weissella oryzae SG25]
MRNQDLLSLMDTLEDSQQQDTKLFEIRQLLATYPLELRGRVDSHLQISASALVFVDKQVIFIKHPYLKTWLLPAGHVELDEQPLATARREFSEETGLKAVGGKLVDVNIIEIPENALKKQIAHRHIDFRFQLELSSQPASLAELPVRLMDVNMASEEFKVYFNLAD